MPNPRDRYAAMRARIITPAEARTEHLGDPDAQLITRLHARDAVTRASMPATALPRVDVRNAADTSDTTEILLYGSIGGWFGIWPEEFAQILGEVTTSKIRLRLDSPGGNVFDGIAIYNLIRDHSAEVHVVVDSMAASIASVIAQAGDRITMNRGSEMMIHGAWAGVIGNAAELRDYADFLDRQSLKVAGIYAAHAGGTTGEWMARMDAETWYFADEAVAAGLATDTGEVPADAADEVAVAAPDSDPLDLVPRRYQSRAEAPAPHEMSTDAAPEVAPDCSAAEAAERQAAARQRRHAVAQVRIDLMRAKLNPGRN